MHSKWPDKPENRLAVSSGKRTERVVNLLTLPPLLICWCSQPAAARALRREVGCRLPAWLPH
jgi:hypothetical protein